jgi:hypothetical protein
MAHGPWCIAGASKTEDRGSGSSPELGLAITPVHETSRQQRGNREGDAA